MVIGTRIQPFSNTPAASTVKARLMTLAQSTYTANPDSAFIIEGETFSPGGVVTNDSTTLSLATAPTDVIVGIKTEPIRLTSYIKGAIHESSATVTTTYMSSQTARQTGGTLTSGHTTGLRDSPSTDEAPKKNTACGAVDNFDSNDVCGGFNMASRYA